MQSVAFSRKGKKRCSNFVNENKGKPLPRNLEKELLGADKPAVVATDAHPASARGEGPADIARTARPDPEEMAKTRQVRTLEILN